MLTPVSFRQGRGREPRLSEARAPGRHSDRFWTEAEIAVVREHYAARGPAHCLALLPGRSIGSIYQRALLLGLRAKRERAARTKLGDRFDEAIRAAWPGLAGRGAVQRLADSLGLKRAAVSSRALALGLTLPHKKEPPWTQTEDSLLRQAPVNDPKKASAFFRANGFVRSPTSIMVRCRRIGLSRRRADVLSATACAGILGVNSKTFADWIKNGDVAAEKRGTNRLAQQGGDTWSVRPEELRRFIIDNLDRVDIRKVDKHAFVSILTAPAPGADGTKPREVP